MWSHKFRFLLLNLVLLSADSQAPPPPQFRNRIEAGPSSVVLLSSSVPPMDVSSIRSDVIVRHLVSGIANSLHGLVHLHGNLSCAELEDGPWKGAGFSAEILGLVMVPVLVSAGCGAEAEDLVRNLMATLGPDDTQELLEDVVALMRRSSVRRIKHVSVRHLEAMMFNIQQLVKDEDASGLEKRCQGWMRMRDVALLGPKFDHRKMRLRAAKRVCRNLGFVCAGVKQDPTSPESYHTIRRPGSRLIPAPSTVQSESWIQSCRAWPVRWRRHTTLQPGCTNDKEERVYQVVDWIPGVSTLYNLGTAVYYASKSCSDTAKERALMSAVDLGTDALMAATGGTAGIAGFALGAGLKTGVRAGVKYLLNRIKQEEDLLMNQNSWEEETFSFQK